MKNSWRFFKSITTKLFEPELLREAWRYFAVSAVALAIDYALLVGLTEKAHVPYLTSSAIGYVAGGFVHYLLSVALVFRYRKVSNRLLEFAGFIGVGLLGLAVTQIILVVAVRGVGMPYALAKIGAVGASFVSNFAVRRAVLFARSPTLRRGGRPESTLGAECSATADAA